MAQTIALEEIRPCFVFVSMKMVSFFSSTSLLYLISVRQLIRADENIQILIITMRIKSRNGTGKEQQPSG